MPQANLTAASIERFKVPSKGQVEYFDRLLPSFGLRISHQGTRAWFVTTRLNRKQIRLTLGRSPGLSLVEARKKAREALELVAAGKDPRALKASAEEERQVQQRNTFAACATEFMRQHAERRLRESTQREYRRVLFGSDTRRLRPRPIREITKRDLVELIEAIDARGAPVAAARTRVYLAKFFGWCAERDIIDAVPTDRIPAPYPEVKRDRVLTQDEVRDVVEALHQDDTLMAKAILLLLLTGQRRSEVAGLRRSEVRGLDGPEPVWQIPGDRTKNGETHLVPLSDAAASLLRSLPQTESDLLFTTTGETPVSGFSRVKGRLDATIARIRADKGNSPMDGWRVHDLRRTMVTMMNEQLAIAPHVVEAVVNHVSGLAKAGVAGVYNRALYLNERRKALDAWADYVRSLTPVS